jgi:hypothetical protein
MERQVGALRPNDQLAVVRTPLATRSSAKRVKGRGIVCTQVRSHVSSFSIRQHQIIAENVHDHKVQRTRHFLVADSRTNGFDREATSVRRPQRHARFVQ